MPDGRAAQTRELVRIVTRPYLVFGRDRLCHPGTTTAAPGGRETVIVVRTLDSLYPFPSSASSPCSDRLPITSTVTTPRNIAARTTATIRARAPRSSPAVEIEKRPAGFGCARRKSRDTHSFPAAHHLHHQSTRDPSTTDRRHDARPSQQFILTLIDDRPSQ